MWPRYKDNVMALAELSWSKAPTPANGMKDPKAPEWFKEIIELQAKGLLNLVFSSTSSWVVVPEAVQGFSLVVYKKPQEAVNAERQSELKLRNHSFDQFNELSALVQRILVMMIKQTLKQNQSEIMELENEDMHMFIFARSKMEVHLRALGFTDEQIPKLFSIEDLDDENQ